MFKKPELEVIKFLAQDVLTTSGEAVGGENDGEIDWG